MTVKFSVVGIFFSTEVDWNAFPGSTVADVMDYIAGQDSNFSYTTTGSGADTFVSSITYVHTSSFTGRTGIEYPPGTYTLPDPNGSPNTPNSYPVWQYYLADENDVRKRVAGDTSFTASSVGDRWSIVWRFVQISNGPVNTPKRLRKTIPQTGRDLQGLS